MQYLLVVTIIKTMFSIVIQMSNRESVFQAQAENDVKPSGYALSIPRGKIIDAAFTQSGLARYANGCRAGNKRAKQCKGSNSKFSTSTMGGVTRVWLTSTKLIRANTEVFVSYGKAHWDDV